MNGRKDGTPTSRRRKTRSRNALLLAAITLFGLASGCANRQLKVSTTRQAQTVVDLEYQQILDNLAMFCLNPSALPSLATLKTGATQVGDTGTLGFLGVAGLNTTFGSSPTVVGTRTIVDQWGSSPMTDDNNLLLVRKAYRSALGYKDLLDDDEANDLAHDLSAQIGTTSDMSVDQDTLGRIYGQDLVNKVVWPFMSTTYPQLVRPPLPRDHKSFQEKLKKLSRLLANARETIGEDLTDTLDHEILAKSYAFDFRRRIDVLLLKKKNYNEDDMKAALNDGLFDGEQRKDTLIVAERADKFEVRLFDHEGKAVSSLTIDQSWPDEYKRFQDIAKGLWNPPYLQADENREILEAVVKIAGLKPMLKERFEPLGDSATGLAKETIYRINDTQKTLDEIRPGWFRNGPEKPKDACYVGHASFCGQECYVWVCRDGLEELAKFTRNVLKLGTTLKDVQVVTAPSGIQFAPALTNPAR